MCPFSTQAVDRKLPRPFLTRSLASRGAGLSLVTLFAALISFAPSSEAQETSSLPPAPELEPLPPISSPRQYWRANQNEAERDRERRLDLTFTVLYYDPAWKILYILESGNGDYLPTTGEALPIAPGDLVRLTGSIVPSQPIPSEAVEVEILRHDKLPQPLPLENHWDHYLEFHNAYVVLEGFVDQISDEDPGHLTYDFISAGKLVKTTVKVAPGQPIPALENKLARIRGVFSVNPSQGGQPESLTLWASGTSELEALPDESAALFALEPTPLDQLPNAAPDQLVKIQARVFSRDPGAKLVLVDASGHIALETVQRSELHRDDFVEAVGKPALRDSRWTLENPIYRIKPDPTLYDIAAAPGTRLKYVLAQQIRESDPEQLDSDFPVTLSGVVTYYDPSGRFFYLQDASAGVRVKLMEPPDRAPAPGEGAIVKGFVAQGEFSPCVVARSLDLKGDLSTPIAIELSYEQARNGHLDSQWIRMSGIVDRVEPANGSTRIHVSTSQGRFEAYVSDREGAPELPVGAMVDLEGSLSIRADSLRRLTDFELLVPSKFFVSPHRESSADSAAIPLSTITSLQRFQPTDSANRRARVRGVATYHIPHEMLFITDGAESLRVIASGLDTVAPGSLVEVVGIPKREGRRLQIHYPAIEILGLADQPTPELFDPSEGLLHPELDGHSVSFAGKLLEVQYSTSSRKTRLVVQNGSSIVEAFGYFNSRSAATEALVEGATVTLSGIYELELDRYGEPEAMRVLLRDENDVTVLSRPPWLTPARLMTGAGISLVALLAAGLWTVLLNRRIKSQTAQIKDQLAREAHLENKHREVIAKASDFIFTFDETGRFLSCNQAGEQITGYSPAELKRLAVNTLLGDDPSSPEQRIFAKERLAHPTVVETRIRRKDGSSHWVEIAVGCLNDEARSFRGYGVMRDVDARKLAELELTRARDAAEVSAKAKNAFLAMMSHELRTPMNGVIGMTELLQDLDIGDRAHDYVDTIRDSANSLLALLNDLLDMSKAEAGKLTIDPHPFQLLESIRLPVTLLQSTAQAKGVELRFDPAEDLPETTIGDAGRLRQILLNLIGNAVKFTENGHVSLTVSQQSESERDWVLRFEIADTGIGIPEQVQAKLFAPFQQADASLSRKFGGTGLGLYVSRAIVSLMNGEIGLRSEPGRGSTFWFTARLAKPDPADARADASSAKQASKWTGRPLSVLIVEDTPVNQRVTRLQLKKMGVEADVASDGFQALAAVDDKRYDVIFMDCQMPELDGLEATRRIRENPKNGGIYIVALTAGAMESDRDNCLAAGMDDYLSKPTRADKLLAALHRATTAESQTSLN